MTDYDVLVIGAGPGGYVAAIRCAQLGLRTACVERAELGGICLNWGCIPTKALLRSAEVLELCRRAGDFGVRADGVAADFGAMVARSRAIAAKISKGVAYLFRKNGVESIAGTARLLGAGKVEIAGDAGSRTVSAEHIIVATGARARSLPVAPFDGRVVLSYREAMTLPAVPASLVVVGAGAIGVEFASLYRSLGAEVTIVEYVDRLVPLEDEDVSAELARAFKKRGIRVETGCEVTAVEVRGDRAAVTVARRTDPAARHTVEAERVLVSVGVAPNTDGLGLEDIGVTLDRGFIRVDDDLRTDVRGVYAIGDVCTVGPALAHVASAQGVQVAEHIAGAAPVRIDYDCIPACTYCHPEIASVGLTEAQARARGIELRVGRFPFGPLGKTVAAGEYPGFAKFLWDARDHSLVGAHLIGPAVTDLIAEPTLAKSTEVNAESLMHTVHAHPTFAEALKGATEEAFGRAIDI
ncbi:MAG: dihydrolipoyl dehydrogenase [Deltaproteobacteria bacterium]|nr:MAG: dihydrolipoyl dehydrogenase [Deltaproteobacteria bacterium]